MSEETIPPGWATTEIKDLITQDGVFVDGDWVESKDQDPDGDVRLIQLADIGEGAFLDKSARFLTSAKAEELRCSFLKKGDVLIARMPDPLGRACIFPLEGENRYVTVVDVCIIRTSEQIASPEFLIPAINFLGTRKQMEDLQTGTTRKRISRGNLANVTIPLPPLPEQKRIVAKIEELFSELEAGEASLRKARRQLGVYRQSLLKQAFEGKLTQKWRTQNPDKLESPSSLLARIGSARSMHGHRLSKSAPEVIDRSREKLPVIPSAWHWLRLEHVAVIGTGMSVSQARAYEDPVEVPYLRVANVQRGRLDLTEMRTMMVEKSRLHELRVKTGDVLFNEGGDRDKLGRGWVWEGQIDPCITQNHVFRATPVSTSIMVPEFISHWGNAFGQDFFHLTGKQTTNLASISKGTLSSLPVPVPPVEEQKEILRILDEQFEAIERNERELDAALKRSEALRQSILKKAFSGRLVPQDPADPPASALLARLRVEREATPTAKRRTSRLL